MHKNNAEYFNTWAKAYNQSIKTSEQDNSYPFSGYSLIKAWIIATLQDDTITSICDMGIGTGQISSPLYDKNKSITGIDFSKEMLKKSRDLMPKATLAHSDFQSFISQLKTESFDAIIFNYSIHHMPLQKQVELLLKLSNHLNDGGMILVGDVMTSTDKAMRKLKIQYQKIWDDAEYYPVVDYYKDYLKDAYQVIFYQVSHCSGMMQLKKNKFL